jgi:hypothetical protein
LKALSSLRAVRPVIAKGTFISGIEIILNSITVVIAN